MKVIIYILKLEASVCVCHGSQRVLTLYTQQPTALLCCDRYIRCQRSLAVKLLIVDRRCTVSRYQFTVMGRERCLTVDFDSHDVAFYNYTTVVRYASGVVSCITASLSAIIMSLWLVTYIFVVITCGKVLWLWKSLENSGNFFSPTLWPPSVSR